MNFLKEEIRKYYQTHAPDYPYMVERREFGFGFEKKIDFRHKRFETNDELKNYLVANAPLFVSYSVAYYSAPEARPMSNKNIQGSDLVFDIDVHDCKNHGEGFVCDECLGRAKEQTVHLIEEFLKPDFGISSKDLSVNFSGNRGYHIHVNDGRYKDFGNRERIEIVNYLNGLGLDAGIFIEAGANSDSPAWFGRIARCIKRRLEEGRIKTAKRQEYLDNIVFGMWKGIAESTWFYREFEECRLAEKANVDEQVTSDVSRLIRLPGTIHGEAMLIAKKVENMDKFDPLRDAVFLGDEEVEVEVSHAPKTVFNEREFDEINNKKTILPKYYAAYLIGKGVAKLV